jgi:hypothetical protein
MAGIVMRIGPREQVHERARRALWQVGRDGRAPVKWKLGREVMAMLRRDMDPRMEFLTLFGLPYEVKGDAPPDLLELDVF